MSKEIEFRLINDEELPPIIISKTEDDSPRIMINVHHRLWITLNRGIIAGIFEALPKKVTEVLDAYLREQYNFEVIDRGE